MIIYERDIEVCYSPALFQYHNPQDKIVVIIDVLRASSVICTALAHGVKEIIPVANVDDAFTYRDKGYLIGAERSGIKVEGADIDNSPFSYMDANLVNKKIALTTTNGTQAINIAKEKNTVVIGCFLNYKVLCNWLILEQKDILILCAGWKNKYNLEDTFCAGAIVDYLTNYSNFSTSCDSAISAKNMYLIAANSLYDFLCNSSHFQRLQKQNKLDDIKYCLSFDKTNVVPILINNKLIDALKK